MKTDLSKIYEPDFQQYGERAIIVDNEQNDELTFITPYRSKAASYCYCSPLFKRVGLDRNGLGSIYIPPGFT